MYLRTTKSDGLNLNLLHQHKSAGSFEFRVSPTSSAVRAVAFDNDAQRLYVNGVSVSKIPRICHSCNTATPSSIRGSSSAATPCNHFFCSLCFTSLFKVDLQDALYNPAGWSCSVCVEKWSVYLICISGPFAEISSFAHSPCTQCTRAFTFLSQTDDSGMSIILARQRNLTIHRFFHQDL